MREAAKKRMQDAQSPPTQEPRLRSIGIVFEVRIESEALGVHVHALPIPRNQNRAPLSTSKNSRAVFHETAVDRNSAGR